MRRRDFLGGATLALGATAVGAANSPGKQQENAAETLVPGDWQALRALFPLTQDYVHLATFLLASHPEPVARTIEEHRRGLDANPTDYYRQHYTTMDMKVARAAADYMGGPWSRIALTDSTTMGLAMVYSGIGVQPGDELLQTEHDHYSTDMSLAHKAARSGATVKRIALYDEPSEVSAAQCQQRLQEAITDRTRVVAVTWVHSSTGVKLPVRALADVVAQANTGRDEADKILFCVDGVHGFGIEDVDVSTLGCDFFIAGTHKWIFGPRGTGIIWGSERGWARSEPVIPGFSASFAVWLGKMEPEQVPPGMHFTPGGFHSFEHRWALPEAFALHRQLGKTNVQKRIHGLNTQTKEGLAAMPHVTLRTPMDTKLSSGLVCFDVKGMEPGAVVARLHDKGIIMSATPYRTSHARFAPSLLNNEQEMDRALAEIRALA